MAYHNPYKLGNIIPYEYQYIQQGIRGFSHRSFGTIVAPVCTNPSLRKTVAGHRLGRGGAARTVVQIAC